MKGIGTDMRRYLPTVSFVVLVVAWSVASMLTPHSDVFLPQPHKVLEAARRLFVEQDFIQDVLASIYRVTVGFMLALLVGYPIGLLIGTSKTWQSLIEPLNEFARYLPVAALIPLVIVWAGIGDLQKVIIIFLGTVFQFVPMVSASVARVPKNLIELGQVMGFGRLGIVTRVVAPSSAPEIYDHARICLGWAWSYVIVAELVAAESGIGHVIIQAQRFIQTADVMSGIITIGIIGVLFDTAARLPRRLLFRWLPA